MDRPYQLTAGQKEAAARELVLKLVRHRDIEATQTEDPVRDINKFAGPAMDGYALRGL